MNNNIIVSDEKLAGKYRFWLFKSGNKHLARIYWPNELTGCKEYHIEYKGCGTSAPTLEAAAQKVQKWINDMYFTNVFTGQASPFTIKDKKGYPLDLLITFEDELLQDVAI